MEFHRLKSKEELTNSFPLMRELRTHLTPQTYLELLEDMAAEGYELWALSKDGDMKALAGIGFRTNLYYGRYVWVFDLVTKPSERSAGYGASLLNHIEQLANQRGCDVVLSHRGYSELMLIASTSRRWVTRSQVSSSKNNSEIPLARPRSRPKGPIALDHSAEGRPSARSPHHV